MSYWKECHCRKKKEKNGENWVDNTGKSNKNAIAVNSTCHWESGVWAVCTGIIGKDHH
jgi:hypothetical protein